jgi:hypothetical protein
MKSALLAAIFGITGGVAMLLAEDKGAAVKFLQARAEEGLPPQRETEPYVVLEPVERYSSIWRYAAGAQFTQAKAKPEKQATHRARHVARPRRNFFEKLVASFMKLQKHEPAKSSCKRFRTTSRRG